MTGPTIKTLLRSLTIVALTQLLTACDIEPVSTGSWDIEVETTRGVQASVWTISNDGTINIAGETNSLINDAVLQGSRIVWSGEAPNPEAPGQIQTLNFNGTVDGNKLQGTLFTTDGNLTVTGSR